MPYLIRMEKYWRINVAVPSKWKDLVIRRVKDLGYTSVGDYVRDLVRKDLKEAGLLGGSNEQHSVQ